MSLSSNKIKTYVNWYKTLLICNLLIKLFEVVRKTDPDYMCKLEAIEGDLLHADLGISSKDRQVLIDSVNVVFHSAATVRFDEPIRVAVQMNLIGTQRVIELCKELKKLCAFVHVSTAYANCDRSTVAEEVYKPPIEPNKLIEMLDLIDDNLADYISPIIIKPKPNTYTYTKAIAEWLVVKECSNNNGHGPVPACIVRPSIITASWREPFPGWIGKSILNIFPLEFRLFFPVEKVLVSKNTLRKFYLTIS